MEKAQNRLSLLSHLFTVLSIALWSHIIHIRTWTFFFPKVSRLTAFSQLGILPHTKAAQTKFSPTLQLLEVAIIIRNAKGSAPAHIYDHFHIEGSYFWNKVCVVFFLQSWVVSVDVRYKPKVFIAWLCVYKICTREYVSFSQQLTVLLLSGFQAET